VSATISDSRAVTKSWRDVLPIHPAADLFPLMAPDELKALGEDIRKHGLRIPTIWWRDPATRRLYLLDGRNRLDAMEASGRNIVLDDTPGHDVTDLRGVLLSDYWHVLPPRGPHGENYPDPYAYVISANIHRSHLTAEQKRELIAKLIKTTPEKSDRQIAETVKASPTTVGTVRAEMEAKGDVSNLDTRTDTKGRKQPVKKATKPKTAKGPAADEPAVEAQQCDVGPDSAGEVARLQARIVELEAVNRRLEIKVAGLESRIAELTFEIPPFMDRTTAH
jgi:hypothetical protein